MKIIQLCFFCFSLVIIVSCGTTKEIPAEWQANYRYSRIDMRLFKDQLIRFLDYRAYKNIITHLAEVDSSVTWGIVMPASSYRFTDIEQEMQFGNASDTCTIHYAYLLKYYKSTNRSLLMDILDKESYKKEKETTQSLEFIKAEGVIQLPGISGAVKFTYEEEMKTGGKLSGLLLINNDTLIINRVKKEDYPFKAGKAIQLQKEGTVYALLLKENDVLKNSIMLTNKASNKEQLLIAAYFAVIAWHY